MRIAIFNNLPAGGALRSTRSILERLRANHEITCFTLSTGAGSGQAFEDVCDKLVVRDFESKAGKWPRRLAPMGWLVDLNRITALEREIAEEINSGGYDLCFTSNCMFFEAPAIHRYLRIPVVYYSRSSTYPVIIRPGSPDIKPRRHFNPAGYIFDRRLRQEKQANITCAGTVVTNSFFSCEELFRLYGVNAIANYPAVDTTKFYRVEGIEKQKVVFGVGSLASFKAHDFSIRALSTISKQSRPELWIAYHFEEPKEKNYLTSLADTLGVMLKLFQNASTEQLRELYSAATATVFPSIFEPLGLVPLESMACGTPVVGVAEGGIRETIVDGVTGFLTQRDPEDFGEAVLRLLEDEKMAADMGRAGKEHVMSKWTWDQAIAQLEIILAKAAKCQTPSE